MDKNTKRLEAYLKKHPPPGNRSRLYPYRSLILEMREMGASLRQICDFLKIEEGVKISNQYLSSFLRKLDQNKAIEILSKTALKTTSKPVSKTLSEAEMVPEWMPKIKPGFGLFD